jgi:hypothetical protein
LAVRVSFWELIRLFYKRFAVLLTMIFVGSAFAVYLGFVPRVSSSTTVEFYGGPLKFYIVDLEGVGGSKAANHSALVEGARYGSTLSWNEPCLTFALDDYSVRQDYFVSTYLNTSSEVVHDWEVFRQMVANGSNLVVVNSHDEILPVPEGYTKEQWVGVIADFLLDRWGTWVHTGGAPFHVVKYQNGSSEEWNDGFDLFLNLTGQSMLLSNVPAPSMSFVGRRDYASHILDQFGVPYEVGGGHWSVLGQFHWVRIKDVAERNTLKLDAEAFGNVTFFVYGNNASIVDVEPLDTNIYASVVGLRLSSSADRYGVFVFSSAVDFYDPGGNYIPDHECSLGMGAIPVATALCSEVGFSAQKILRAQLSGSKNEALVQTAIETFGKGDYKQAAIFAEKATQQTGNVSSLVLALASISGVAVSGGMVFRHYRNGKTKIRKKAD